MPRKPKLDPVEQGLAEAVRLDAVGDPAGAAVMDCYFAEPIALERFGNLARLAERKYVDAICADDLVTRAALVRKLPLLRAELAGAAATPLETLLVDRIVVCWLAMHYATVYCIDPDRQSRLAAESMQRWQTACQNRLLAAVRALGVLRRLLRPSPSAVDFMMANVAERPPRPPERPAAPVAAGRAVLN